MKYLFLLIAVLFLAAGCANQPAVPDQEPIHIEIQKCAFNDVEMTLEQAIQIAEDSECNQGTLKQIAVCNDITGTWWIDLDIESQDGCNPACVIYLENKSAEINWRCTGLIQE